MRVSIVIPVLDRLEFTRQCLDRIWRNTGDDPPYEVIVVDNGSSDGTYEWFAAERAFPHPLRYHRNSENLGYARANNVGAALAQGDYLLFLNNDTLVQPGWMREILAVAESDKAVGIVGIKQLFPYTNTIYHTGIVFAPDGRPEHLYPHLDASLSYVNKQREYQAVTGACLLIDRAFFGACGGFDEAYRNGYEDIDLCMKVRQRGRKIVCCTGAYIYHYGQISEGRTSQDDRNAALFAERWSGQLKPDRDEYVIRDRAETPNVSHSSAAAIRSLAPDCIYLADALDEGSALTWINAELALALNRKGVPVFVNAGRQLSETLPAAVRRELRPLTMESAPVGGIQIKWSHYRPQHLTRELNGDVNFEFFVINYLFRSPGSEPWDLWLQCLRNQHAKLALSEVCKSVLLQVGIPDADCAVWHPGYSKEIPETQPPARRDARYRFLTVTNSHDLERYNTSAVIQAFQNAFAERDDVALVIKDYGASSGDRTIRNLVAGLHGSAHIEYIAKFSDKRELIDLYRSCDAFISAHRGEGFGMKILDAMACGLPVIMPLFGGPTDYCRPDNCFPVDFSLVPVGACLDTRALHITNQPVWAEINPRSLEEQLRRVYSDRESAAAVGARWRAGVAERFSWDASAARLIEIASEHRSRHGKALPAKPETQRSTITASPYWLGVRITVVVPTHNRKDKLLASLDALSRQTILPHEFEVVVVDDGSSDGTKEALDARRFPFTLRYFRQDAGGPGAARNLGIQRAEGELVLFIGDDILADERLLEEHLLAHAASPDPGTAILGHIDWAASLTPNAVMDWVCGDGKLQFAYAVIPKLPALDHRFFYTSNISLKRQFLVDAAAAGIGFDPRFGRAAFEDSEFALRLMPRGLRIRYAASARAAHDHYMDLDSFARREFGAGEMSVVFYRKHPALDSHLQVAWIADSVRPAAALLEQPEFLGHLEAFDRQTDTLLRALAGALEEMIALTRQPQASTAVSLSADRLRAALNNVLRVVFDVERTRGKVQEWYADVRDSRTVDQAKTLASVTRKIEFLEGEHPLTLQRMVAPFDSRAVADLGGRLGIQSRSDGASPRPIRERVRRRIRRLIAAPSILSRLVDVDRYIETRLQSPARASWLTSYRRVRSRIRRVIT